SYVTCGGCTTPRRTERCSLRSSTTRSDQNSADGATLRKRFATRSRSELCISIPREDIHHQDTRRNYSSWCLGGEFSSSPQARRDRRAQRLQRREDAAEKTHRQRIRDAADEQPRAHDQAEGHLAEGLEVHGRGVVAVGHHIRDGAAEEP